MVPDETHPSRRRFGIALATALTLPAAGCLGDDDGEDDDGGSNDDGDGNESDADGDGNGTDDGMDDDNESGDGDDDTLFDATVLWVAAVDEDGGDPVADAAVTVAGDDDEREDETGSNGEAFFSDLEAGEYEVTVETDAGSAEDVVELEEGDDGEVELEVPVPDEDEDEE